MRIRGLLLCGLLALAVLTVCAACGTEVTAAQLEAARQEAYDEGYEEGRIQGEREGYQAGYRDGVQSVSPTPPETPPDSGGGTGAGSTVTVDPEVTYIANKRSMKFHRTDCESVGDIAEHNRLDWTGTREDLTAQGYRPCQRCSP